VKKEKLDDVVEKKEGLLHCAAGLLKTYQRRRWLSNPSYHHKSVEMEHCVAGLLKIYQRQRWLSNPAYRHDLFFYLGYSPPQSCILLHPWKKEFMISWTIMLNDNSSFEHTSTSGAGECSRTKNLISFRHVFSQKARGAICL